MSDFDPDLVPTPREALVDRADRILLALQALALQPDTDGRASIEFRREDGQSIELTCLCQSPDRAASRWRASSGRHSTRYERSRSNLRRRLVAFLAFSDGDAS